jgi:hypothetical protein
MYVCMYVCMYMYLYVCERVSIFVCMYACINVNGYVFFLLCLRCYCNVSLMFILNDLYANTIDIYNESTKFLRYENTIIVSFVSCI